MGGGSQAEISNTLWLGFPGRVRSSAGWTHQEQSFVQQFLEFRETALVHHTTKRQRRTISSTSRVHNLLFLAVLLMPTSTILRL